MFTSSRSVLVKVVPEETDNQRAEGGLELCPQAEAAEGDSRGSRPGEAVGDGIAEDAEESFADKYLALVLYISYLVLPSVTTTIFSAFPTFNANPSNVAGLPVASKFLAVDYSIVYGSYRYWQGVTWAIVMILVYPVGIPLLYLWMLYRNRNEIQEYKELQKGERNLFICFYLYLYDNSTRLSVQSWH